MRVLRYLAAHVAAGGVHQKRLMLHAAAVKQIARVDAQAVAALLRFGTVRVDDAQGGIDGVAAVDQQAVGTDAVMRVAQQADLFMAQPIGDRTVAYQVVVAQTVIFVEQQGSHGVARLSGKRSLQLTTERWR